MDKILRLTGKELFVYYSKKLGMESKDIYVGGCTNKRILSKKTGIDYNTLMKVFTRKGMRYYDDGDIVIMKLYTSDIEKGGQSLKRKGKGGMENFIKFVMKNSRDY